MKIALMVPGKYPVDINKMQRFTEVVNYFLVPEIERVCDCQVIRIPKAEKTSELIDIIGSVDLSDFDAMIFLGQRYVSYLDRSVIDLIHERFTGLICQICDSSRLKMDPVDITFVMKEAEPPPNLVQDHIDGNNLCIGWGASPSHCVSDQSDSELRILVDHTLYHEGEDWTGDILNSLHEYVRSESWRDRYESVRVRQMVSGGVIDVNFDNPNIEQYDRSGIPYPEICREYSGTHVFCVTHRESLGLTALETAMCGALVISPSGCIPKDRLDTIRHVEFTESIDWETTVNMIDRVESRKQALSNTWESMAMKIISHLSNFL